MKNMCHTTKIKNTIIYKTDVKIIISYLFMLFYGMLSVKVTFA